MPQGREGANTSNPKFQPSALRPFSEALIPQGETFGPKSIESFDLVEGSAATGAQKESLIVYIAVIVQDAGLEVSPELLIRDWHVRGKVQTDRKGFIGKASAVDRQPE